MDLNTVEAVSIPSRRDEVWPLGPNDAIVAGGTWLFSEPQPTVSRLVDITRLGWPPVTLTGDGIELAATCTLSELGRLSRFLPSAHPHWVAAPLFAQCSTALVASFKILGAATVGGNICLSLPAGSMISLASALDGVGTVWRADGTDYEVPIADVVVGDAINALRSGDILRSVFLPAAALSSRTAFRKIAPTPLGRSAAVVIGRCDTAGAFRLSITATTVRPYVFDFADLPKVADLRRALSTIPDEHITRDAHGDPDWRRAVTLILAEQILDELT